MKHLGILATTWEGAALCFRVFCQQGAGELGPQVREWLPVLANALGARPPATSPAGLRGWSRARAR